MYIFERGAPKITTFLAPTLYSLSKSCSQGENPKKRGLLDPRQTPALPQCPTCTHSPSTPFLLSPFELAMPKKVPLCFQVKISTVRGTTCPSTAQTARGRRGFSSSKAQEGETGGGERAGACRGPAFLDHVRGLYLAAGSLTPRFQPTRLLPAGSSQGCPPPPPSLLLLGVLRTLSSAPAPCHPLG